MNQDTRYYSERESVCMWIGYIYIYISADIAALLLNANDDTCN